MSHNNKITLLDILSASAVKNNTAPHATPVSTTDNTPVIPEENVEIVEKRMLLEQQYPTVERDFVTPKETNQVPYLPQATDVASTTPADEVQTVLYNETSIAVQDDVKPVLYHEEPVPQPVAESELYNEVVAKNEIDPVPQKTEPAEETSQESILLFDDDMEEFASNVVTAPSPLFPPVKELEEDMELDMPITNTSNASDLDAEDIDEAYRKRLAALGLAQIELEEPDTTAVAENTFVAAPPEVVAEETADIDDALSDAVANFSNQTVEEDFAPTTAVPTEPTIETVAPTFFSPLDFGEDAEGNSNTTVTTAIKEEKKPELSLAQQYRKLQDRNSTFVFMFGRQQAGKTVILSSLAYHMGVDENGLLETRRRIDNLKGAAYLKQLSQSVRKGQFMNRTAVGSLYELDLTYTPTKPEVPMNFTFLEMSGEDLTKVELSESSAGQLPSDIDVYLNCPGLDSVFMIVVPYEDAEEHDYLVIDFLDYLKERKPDMDYSKILLLISKWDRYEGTRKDEVDLFVKEQMPRTFSRLKAKKATIARYSIGEVSDDNQHILNLNTERPEAVKRWLYGAVTGRRIKDEKESIWSRLKRW